MRGFIAGAAVVVAIMVLVGASWKSGAGLPALKDLPLAHAFNGNFGISQGNPLKITMPHETGFVVTHFMGGKEAFFIRINGLLLRAGQPYDLGIAGPAITQSGVPIMPAIASDPPLIVPPGGTLEVSTNATKNTGIRLGGYFISRSNLGIP